MILIEREWPSVNSTFVILVDICERAVSLIALGINYLMFHEIIKIDVSYYDWIHYQNISFANTLEQITDGLVVRAGVSVTWTVLSWSGGHEFEPRSGRTWVHGTSVLSRTWTKNTNGEQIMQVMPLCKVMLLLLRRDNLIPVFLMEQLGKNRSWALHASRNFACSKYQWNTVLTLRKQTSSILLFGIQ